MCASARTPSLREEETHGATARLARAAAVLEACVTARKLPEVEEEELPGERDFQPWQPQRIWTSPARSDASPAHRRPKAPAR